MEGTSGPGEGPAGITAAPAFAATFPSIQSRAMLTRGRANGSPVHLDSESEDDPLTAPRHKPVSAILADVAAAAGVLFAGGALYVSLVEHPARMACGPPMAVAQFRTSYPRAAWLQGGLAVVGCLAAIAAWLGGARGGWLAAGLLLGLVVPYTFVVVMPTNRRLLDTALPPDVPETRRLLRRWGALHAVRTLVGLGAALAMVSLLAR